MANAAAATPGQLMTMTHTLDDHDGKETRCK